MLSTIINKAALVTGTAAGLATASIKVAYKATSNELSSTTKNTRVTTEYKNGYTKGSDKVNNTEAAKNINSIFAERKGTKLIGGGATKI